MSASQTITTNLCSASLVVESRTFLGFPTPVLSNLTVGLTSAPSTPLQFYAGAGCIGPPVTSVVMLAGQSRVSFFARSSAANMFIVTASASGLLSANQDLTVTQAPTSLAFAAALPSPLRAGACLPATVESRHNGAATTVLSDTNVALTVDVADGTRFFTDPSCTSMTTSVTIAAGSTTAGFFFKPRSGVPMVLTATAPFGAGTLGLSPVPIVRRGRCTLRGSSQTCSIDPLGLPQTAATLGRAFLIAQSIVPLGTSTPLDVEARCRLQGVDISCQRRGGGLTSDAETHFQVVELPTGLTVRTASSGSCGTNVNLNGQVDVNRSFVLKSVIGSGTNLDEDDAVSATLIGPSTVLLSSNACDGYEVQAVQFDGASVVRGQPLLPAMSSGSLTAGVTGLAPASSATLVLSQPSTDVRFIGLPLAPCSVQARADVASPSELRFSRGMGRSACTNNTLARIPYERVDFGSQARVWSYNLSLSQSTESFPLAISAVDPTRTFVLTSSQQLGGQGSGEADGTLGATGPDGAVQTVLLNASTVEVRRGPASSAVLVTVYVVQLEP